MAERAPVRAGHGCSDAGSIHHIAPASSCHRSIPCMSCCASAPRMPELRRGPVYRALHRVLARYLGRADFRIVHISIQQTHIHLLVEAGSKQALTAGMQSFAINAARAINALGGGCGKVFPHRYHATHITIARQARNALAYVLNNWRKHREDWSNGRPVAAKLDAYSSALSFTGWTLVFARPSNYAPLPTSSPKTAMLASDWARFGAIDPFEVPGSAR
jgi:REP element-mobilizing transposase RayT